MRRGVRIGALGVVDEQHLTEPADLLHAMRQPRKAAQALLQGVLADAERQRASGSTGGILRIVQATQRADPPEFGDLLARTARSAQDPAALDGDAVGERLPDRD